MAWTAATRGDYVRPSGRYASDVTDREWALIAPLLPAAREGGPPRSTCLRRVMNAIFHLLQTGCQWRMLPRDFPPRSTVYGYFRAWVVAGVRAHIHDVLYRRSRPKRWVVERTFAWACINRRLARDFEGVATTARAFFQIAMIKLMVRRIAHYRDS